MELKEGNNNYRDWGDSHKATCPESLNGPYLPIHHRVRGAARSVSFTAPRGFIPTLRSSCEQVCRSWEQLRPTQEGHT